jgi:hypothetical protein
VKESEKGKERRKSLRNGKRGQARPSRSTVFNTDKAEVRKGSITVKRIQTKSCTFNRDVGYGELQRVKSQKGMKSVAALLKDLNRKYSARSHTPKAASRWRINRQSKVSRRKSKELKVRKQVDRL